MSGHLKVALSESTNHLTPSDPIIQGDRLNKSSNVNLCKAFLKQFKAVKWPQMFKKDFGLGYKCE